MRLSRKSIWLGAVLLTIVIALVIRNQVKVHLNREASRREAETARMKEERDASVRRQVFDELRPVSLERCQLQRFGEAHDGGYLVCGNLLGDVKAAYSYGINGYDKWGCDASTTLGVPTHQYDCFNTTVPSCPSGRTIFHAECVGGTARTEEGRPFDTIASQLLRNGDGANRVIVKIDVEGAEWESFEALPDDVLQRIDQLIVEFHRVDSDRSLAVVQRLKKVFHVAHLHANNASCDPSQAPFTSWAFEATFVNRRLDEVRSAHAVRLPHPLDARNNPDFADCQPVAR
jgi:hypothetical protein